METPRAIEIRTPMAVAAATHGCPDARTTALGSFPKWSAADPSGLRARHLKEALAPSVRGEVLRLVNAAANLLAKGRRRMLQNNGCAGPGWWHSPNI